MKYLPLPLLLGTAAALTLGSDASAGDYIVRVEAFVQSIDGAGSSVAPFSSAALGDTMTVEYSVFYPGTAQSTILVLNGSSVPGMEYEIDYSASSLSFLGQQIPLEDTVPPPFEGGVSASSDLNGVFGYAGAATGFLSLTCWDFVTPPGALLSSSDLAAAVGTSYDPSLSFFSPWLFYGDDFGLGSDGLALVVTSVSVIDPRGAIGDSYCQTNPNSTGATGAIVATGSEIAADNNVTLLANQLPTNAFGFFITSQLQGFVANPNGSQGNLCVSGSIGRYVGAGQIQNSGMGGTFSLVLDLTRTPQPTALVPVQTGETWNFQAWHRDVGPSGPTSNFTDAVSVTFQ